jgi:HNH endonuclease
MKRKVAAKNYYKCANMPGKILRGLEDFLCPLWENRGCFGITYEIDHIVEKALGGSDDEQNLQAICSICHAYKTRCFLMNKKKILLNYKKENDSLSVSDNDIYVSNFMNDDSDEYENEYNNIINDAKQIKILDKLIEHIITRVLINDKYISILFHNYNRNINK